MQCRQTGWQTPKELDYAAAGDEKTGVMCPVEVWNSIEEQLAAARQDRLARNGNDRALRRESQSDLVGSQNELGHSGRVHGCRYSNADSKSS